MLTADTYTINDTTMHHHAPPCNKQKEIQLGPSRRKVIRPERIRQKLQTLAVIHCNQMEEEGVEYLFHGHDLAIPILVIHIHRKRGRRELAHTDQSVS